MLTEDGVQRLIDRRGTQPEKVASFEVAAMKLPGGGFLRKNGAREVEEEEGVEVEEWMYKGLLFFKDTNNLVYTNNNGEPGDPIGTYDPAKNTLKKLKPA